VRFEDVNETELIHQMRMAAMSDPLTELANRRYLMQRLDQEISFSRRHKTPLALMLIDVDGFKSINDTYGHPVGDEVLKSVARLLERAKRREDVVARYAGDEFVIICRGESIDLVLRFAQRIVESVRNHPITVNDRRHTLSFSIGVAELEVDNPDAGPMELFVRADSALYHSKLAGRDRATAFQAGSSHAHPKRGDELDTLRVSIPPERPTDPSK
jgi:diguanylate cyclase (GGDEF)-like protein